MGSSWPPPWSSSPGVELDSSGNKSTYTDAVQVLRSRVDPENRVLAGQDFRHALSLWPSTSDIWRYLFKLLMAVTVLARRLFSYNQLQDGLRYSLIKSPAISGAISYQQLCITARHEEKRLNELARCQQYQKDVSKKEGNRKRDSGARPQQTPTTGGKMVKPHGEPRQCYICGATDHLARSCRKKKTVNWAD